ncbi:uncharacterized protein LOC125191943 [Salvia hispanica]|uniref:uncharacterized protein LOC125191943 n=1 Tax=Salvia hispanica TaxID=49212 RepID=UPI002008F75C|nr:uncharacterized protein LOC125191943 [Salvia hispanica]
MVNLTDCSQLREEVQTQLDSTMPWIGRYIEVATLACVAAMTVDFSVSCKSKRYWQKCKFFSLNAFSLTVLAVTMKIPVDLTITDITDEDQLTRICSIAFLCICMNNFMISLGSMENNDIVPNVAALGLLVITITVNVCIHIVQMVFVSSYMFPQQISSLVIMLLTLAMACCMSLMVPSAKIYTELKYNEMHKLVVNRQVNESIDEVEILVKGYWVMAETACPQFVLARSPISSTSALLCSLTVLLLSFQFLVVLHPKLFSSELIIYCDKSSNYGVSICSIMIFQLIGVIVGSISPISRWFTAWTIRVAETEQKSFRDELKVDKYWTSKLVEWRETPLPFRISNPICRKLHYDVVRFFLNICIVAQILIVSSGKLVLFLSVFLWRASFFHFCKKGGTESSRDVDFSQYVILLEGESQLPDKMVMRICKMADRMIRVGKRYRPKSLIRLVRKSTNFSGVVQFDNNQEVPSLCSQEPPNCWSLPIVTLTTIALALTNTTNDEANQLLASVTQGLSIVKLIEKTLDKNGELESIMKAADAVWIGVEVYKKWDDKDLESMSVRGATHKETLQNLSDVAKQIVTEFTAQPGDVLMHDPLNWPSIVIAANSMYRIAQSILVRVKNGEHQSDDELFGSISITIADILSACLTNLLRVIRLKCHENDFRKRHDSVMRAARLLGESKEILEILQQHELPRLDVEKAGNIDEWRASMAPDIENPLAPPSTSSDNEISHLEPPSTSGDNAISPLASPPASSDNAITPSTSSDNAITPSTSSDNATILG